MLSLKEMFSLYTNLETLLHGVQVGVAAAAEYGTPESSHIRVRWMNTAGGYQFCVCALGHDYEEIGAAYTPDIPTAALMAMSLVSAYHYQSEFLEAARKRRRELNGDFLEPPKPTWELKHTLREAFLDCREPFSDFFLEDVVDIRLPAPAASN